ncbi:hypothetical protein BSP36_123 [Bacillus phage BSP36]|uniref:Uncharacterized protein n=1 Tax=Bacillus phage BSP38 TaxID=2283013 RepID=A0A345MJY5_BPBSP|nr:hypothetical protein HWB82_gp193 [Bacillus phage BSP38]AXH71167.1 hypothetical protein BSP38_125 [Bacillus phage BSP38]AYJ75210.1 hypothetical protein BSP36_123 [Bacillus phage BSP36]
MKYLILQENMVDDDGIVIFEADIPYAVEYESIMNENEVEVLLEEIWVDYTIFHTVQEEI